MDSHIILSFIIGVVIGASATVLSVALFRHVVENKVKAEVAKLLGHVSAFAQASTPKAPEVTAGVK